MATALLGTGLFGMCAGCFSQSGTGPVEDPPASCEDGMVPHGTVVDESETDCITSTCQDGQLVAEPDDTEIPDDGLECTADSCQNGEKIFQSMPGASCGQGGNLMCNQFGQCEGCTTASECGVDSECRIWECDMDNTCGATDPPQGTPVTNQTPGDCQVIQCNGVGGEEPIQNEADVPDDGNECTSNICEKTMPSNPNSPTDTVCSTGFCNGNGACVQCNVPTQCGIDSFCRTHTCTTGMCGLNPTADGTPLPSGQTAGDCKEEQCNGNGGTKTANKDSDLPVDGLECTDDVCLGGVATNPNKSLGAMCNQNGGQTCDGMGACKKKNGISCTAGSECLTGLCTDGVCCNQACDTQCYSCNQTNNVGNCMLVPKDQEDASTCTGMSACNGSGSCLLKNGQTCAMGNQCISGICVDGVCCISTCTNICKACNVTNSVGTCTNIPMNTDDNVPAGICTGMNTCNGSGSCLLKNGQSCTMPAQCASNKCPTPDAGMQVCVP